MRNNVTFVHPAPFEPVSDEDGVLSVAGARWFVEILRRIPGLELDPEPCQEDWGVVVFARRSGSRFWIGVSAWFDFEQGWHAHVNHGSMAILQRFRRAGRQEFARVIEDLHAALGADPRVSSIAWFHEREMGQPNPSPAPTPAE
jgi:hypothetical protein